MSEVAVAAALDVAAPDWRAAVRGAVGLLVEVEAAAPEYVEACVRTVEDHGPYIVLTPGLALAHARPDSGAIRPGLVAARLAAPVEFGHPSNDPVDLVLAFSATDDGGHVAMLAGLARRLQDGLARQLREAVTPAEMRTLLEPAA